MGLIRLPGVVGLPVTEVVNFVVVMTALIDALWQLMDNLLELIGVVGCRVDHLFVEVVVVNRRS